MPDIRDPDPVAVALEDPGSVVRCMILDAAKEFFVTHDRTEPKTIHLTPGMEALLDRHLCGMKSPETLRDRKRLFDWEIIFDSGGFKLE